VPRFGPRLDGWRDADTVSVRPRLLYRTIRDSLILLAVCPAFDVIRWLQDSGLIAILARLP
jgi:hypothetical protein